MCVCERDMHTKRITSLCICVVCAQTLLCPQTSFYSKLSEECVDAGVGIDLFISTTSYNDLATIGQCISTTGGKLHHYPAFKVGGCVMLVLVWGEGSISVCSSLRQHLLWFDDEHSSLPCVWCLWSASFIRYIGCTRAACV